MKVSNLSLLGIGLLFTIGADAQTAPQRPARTWEIGPVINGRNYSQNLPRFSSGNPTFVISHRLPLDEAPKGYDLFKNHQNETTKIVLKPGMTATV